MSVLARLDSYKFFFFLVLFLLVIFLVLVPGITNSQTDMVRALIASFLFGALVGLAEIASRYRDEPLKAVKSPYGMVYVFLNGYISLLAFLLIVKFPATFGSLSGNLFIAALAAGFGAMVVMRARIAVIKTPDGREESIGPDYVLKIILRTIDLNIDRWRAARRQQILGENISKINALGNFETAWKYLLASLLAFQNLDDAQRKELNDTYNDYQNQANLPEAIKQLALGFIFLTLVGELHFSTVLDNAKNMSAQSKTQGASKGSTETGSLSAVPPPPKPPPDLMRVETPPPAPTEKSSPEVPGSAKTPEDK
ncbi:MAG: hypothetical protein ABI596_16635 [Pyrinomonadaceae bacterium]